MEHTIETDAIRDEVSREKPNVGSAELTIAVETANAEPSTTGSFVAAVVKSCANGARRLSLAVTLRQRNASGSTPKARKRPAKSCWNRQRTWPN
jgi:hypothetical protein